MLLGVMLLVQSVLIISKSPYHPLIRRTPPFLGGQAQPCRLGFSLGVVHRCVVVAAGQPAAPDGALLFAQVGGDEPAR